MKERKWLNDYHERVYQEISPHLTKEEAEFLREYTREI
jgi:Xaa-Pro aminopeptidase